MPFLIMIGLFVCIILCLMWDDLLKEQEKIVEKARGNQATYKDYALAGLVFGFTSPVSTAFAIGVVIVCVAGVILSIPFAALGWIGARLLNESRGTPSPPATPAASTETDVHIDF